MEGKVKITVIATGFDRLRVSQSPASEAAKRTPIELTGYAAVARAQTPEPLIANTSRVIVSRRRGLDPAAARPRTGHRGRRYRRSHRRSGSVAVRCARVPPEERG